MSADLEGLVPLVYPWALRLALMLSRDPTEAEDLVQDGLVRAVSRPPEPLSEETLRAWLRTVLFRLYLKRRRAVVREAATRWRLTRERPRPLSEPNQKLLEALAGLVPKQRACVVLFYLEDLAEPDIADVLGIRTGTVKAHLAQARERLREKLTAPD